MPRYSIGFPSGSVEKHFLKELSKLDKTDMARIRRAIESLADNPRPQGDRVKPLRPPLSIYSLVATHRLRVGDYRILYDIDDGSRRVVLLSVRRRSEKTYR
ncbi:MAG: type II toxin-antitoxin system RelE/ParE family toxin [Elusimicrobia bacterium]|nr:type II toxin-antitoxin system RelE/ParE family toxin [Elusimicrobiota bacterium]